MLLQINAQTYAQNTTYLQNKRKGLKINTAQIAQKDTGNHRPTLKKDNGLKIHL